MAFSCPHCQTSARRVSFRLCNPLMQEAFYQCTNLSCGHTFRSQEEVICSTSPSSSPNPLIHIPVAKPRHYTHPRAI